MSLTRHDIECQCELIQDDLLTFFNGLPDEAMTHMCQIIADRMEILKNKLKLDEPDVGGFYGFD